MGHLFSIPSQKGRVTAAPTREPDRLVFSLHLTHPQKGEGKQARFLQGHQPCLVLRSRRWHRPASRLSSVPPPPALPHKGEGRPGRNIRNGIARSPRFLKRTAGKLPRLALTCRVCAAGDREDRGSRTTTFSPPPCGEGPGVGVCVPQPPLSVCWLRFTSRQRRRLRCVVECVEIAQRRLVRQVRKDAVDDERHRLFGQPAMRAQRLVEGSKIMAMFGGADRLVL